MKIKNRFRTRPKENLSGVIRCVAVVLVMLIQISTVHAQQGITVTGTVMENGETMPGVNVTIKGTFTGVVTDSNGLYSIIVPSSNAVLVFSFIGFQTQELVVGDRRAINVTLMESSSLIDEIVVVGYGTTRKSDVTGSVSSVSSKSFLDQPASSATSVLSGRAAGVTVRQTNGAPAGDLLIRIRGTNSLLGGNNPLIVVDGNYGSIPNMYDIESIEILKDASATAIYGSRGANGVILVKTKRGSQETKPKVSIYADVSFNDIPQRYDLMNAYEFAEYNNSVGTYPFTSQEIESFRNNKGTNWQDVFFRTGVVESYKATLSGGSKNMRYYVSPAWNKNTGVVQNTAAGGYGLNAKIDMDLSDRMLVQIEAGVSSSENLNRGLLQGQAKSFAPLVGTIIWSPTEPVYNEDGSFRRIGIGSSSNLNPILSMEQENRNYSNNGSAVANIQVKLIEGLIFDAKGSMSFGTGGSRNFSNKEVTGANTTASQSSYESKTWLLNAYLTYTKAFANVHHFSGMAGFEETKSETQSFSASANDLPLESVMWYNLGLSAPNIGVGSGYSNSAMRSFFGRLNYNYANRYLITANIRSDGSSRFQGNNQFSTFPSVAMAWRISEESFMKNQHMFQNLKFRAGWGITGNQAIASYATYNTLASRSGTWGDVTYPGYIGRTGGNPNLKWESTKQLNFGIDVTTFDSRLSITLDYYDKKTVDLLAPVEVPAYNGGGRVNSNVGSVHNKGFEANINYDILRAKDYAYSINLNGSINSNKVLDVGDQELLLGTTYTLSSVSPFVLKPGYSIGSIYGLKCLGIWQQNEAEEAAKYGLQPGDYKYEDVNKDNVIGSEDYQVIGCAIPKFSWGFNNHFAYKNVDVNLLFEGVHGRDVMNWTYLLATEVIDFTSTYTHRAARDRWTPDNPNAEFARIGCTNLTASSSRYVQNGSYVKLRNVSVAYQMPKSWIPFVNVRLAVSAQNLLTITKYKGFDPEINASTSDIDSGLDWGGYPNARSFSFGISIEY